VAHGVVVVGVVRLRASLPLVHELRVLLRLILSGAGSTSANQPISWLLVCGTFHLSLGVCVTVLSLSLISSVSWVL
jgi:hypothetical protein